MIKCLLMNSNCKYGKLCKYFINYINKWDLCLKPVDEQKSEHQTSDFITTYPIKLTTYAILGQPPMPGQPPMGNHNSQDNHLFLGTPQQQQMPMQGQPQMPPLPSYGTSTTTNDFFTILRTNFGQCNSKKEQNRQNERNDWQKNKIASGLI